jgi:uncharacterized membrane protein YeaQ/YmgE (transglycosylase-associated protein family)
MGFITWIVAGALLGGAASALARTGGRRGFAVNVATGIAGVMTGGWLLGMLIGASAFEPGAFSLGCLLVSLLGAAVLVGVLHEGRGIRFLNERIEMKQTLRVGRALRPLLAPGIAGILMLVGACASVSM